MTVSTDPATDPELACHTPQFAPEADAVRDTATPAQAARRRRDLTDRTLLLGERHVSCVRTVTPTRR